MGKERILLRNKHGYVTIRIIEPKRIKKKQKRRRYTYAYKHAFV